MRTGRAVPELLIGTRRERLGLRGALLDQERPLSLDKTSLSI